MKCEIGNHEVTEQQLPLWTVMATGLGCRCGGPHAQKCCNECYLKIENKTKNCKVVGEFTGKKAGPKVVHCKKSCYDVYIGRPSIWGNPFIIGKDGTRQEVVAKYEQWLLNQPELVEKAKKELKGKILACWCSPEVCHGDVLVRIANE